MSAVQRIAQLDQLEANDLCNRTSIALDALLDVMNQETVLLRAGRLKEASVLTPKKSQMSQDYVTLARAVKRETARLKSQAPVAVQNLKNRHESLATQMAENLRVLATARNVTQDLLSDVAKSVGNTQKPKTYNNGGIIPKQTNEVIKGLAIDRAL